LGPAHIAETLTHYKCIPATAPPEPAPEKSRHSFWGCDQVSSLLARQLWPEIKTLIAVLPDPEDCILLSS
jgi:hypothetical protein